MKGNFFETRDMLNNEYKYLISDMGEWYSITIKKSGHIIDIRDSYKLLPFSVKAIGEAFKTKHKKLSIEYVGIRFAGDEIKPEEKEYIANDVLVVSEALQFMFSQGYKKLTIGSCCLSIAKTFYGGKEVFNMDFPDLSEFPLDKDIYGSSNVDEYIRKSYRGGWCYLAKGKENKVFHNGNVFDVNSLYPSVMSGKSKNVYPVGYPKFWTGDYIPDDVYKDHTYAFIRIRTGFELKSGMLPIIQIKNNFAYRSTEYLETSKITITGKKLERAILLGKEITDVVELTLTFVDFLMIQKHYNLYKTEILDGCYFKAYAGLFDSYINHYAQIKKSSTGAMRQLAKLALNSYYGKFGTNNNSSYKVAYLDNDIVHFATVQENNKPLVYIPVASAVTSYARKFTIEVAQANYYGSEQRGFIYADTDSVHCDLSVEEIKGVELSDTEFLCWKHESSWSEAIFSHQKTYIEHTENGISVTACGMGKRCKELLSANIDRKEIELKTENEKRFMETKLTIADFKEGLTIPSNIKQKRIKGGVILEDVEFKIR